MSHHERLAWITLASVLLPYVPYFTWAEMNPPSAPLPDFPTMKVFAAAAVSQLAIYLIGATSLRLVWPSDATAKLDERDRAISRRSLAASYGVLISGLIVAGMILPFDPRFGGWKQVNVALLAVVIAEVVRCVMLIWSYRRGWSGTVAA